MKRGITIFAVTVAVLCAVAPAGWAQAPQLRLSWGTCSPQVQNANFAASTFNMVVSARNLTAADANVGTDITVYVGPNVPEAWRFDDAGCQTGSQITFSNAALSKACPVMKGTNSLTITNAAYDPAGTAGPRLNIRLAITYDTFTPVPGTEYTLWQVGFNHAFSAAGTDADPNTCDQGDLPQCIGSTHGTSNPDTNPSILLAATGSPVPFLYASTNDEFLTWNNASVGTCDGVPALPATWGKVKGLYR